MKNNKTLNDKNTVDVRYKASYAIFIVFIALFVFIIPALSDFDITSLWKLIFLYIIRLIAGLIFLFGGINILTGRKYFGLDKKNKMLIAYGMIFSSSEKSFDRIHIETDKIYIEVKGKKKKLNIAPWICNKSDFDLIRKEIHSLQ
jgi:hypothetical protein